MLWQFTREESVLKDKLFAKGHFPKVSDLRRQFSCLASVASLYFLVSTSGRLSPPPVGFTSGVSCHVDLLPARPPPRSAPLALALNPQGASFGRLGGDAGWDCLETQAKVSKSLYVFTYETEHA